MTPRKSRDKISILEAVSIDGYMLSEKGSHLPLVTPEHLKCSRFKLVWLRIMHTLDFKDLLPKRDSKMSYYLIPFVLVMP